MIFRLLKYLLIPLSFLTTISFLHLIYEVNQNPLVPLLYLPISILTSLSAYDAIARRGRTYTPYILLLLMPALHPVLSLVPLLFLFNKTSLRKGVRGWIYWEGLVLKKVKLGIRLIGRIEARLPFPIYYTAPHLYLIESGRGLTLSKAYGKALKRLRERLKLLTEEGIPFSPVHAQELLDLHRSKFRYSEDDFDVLVIKADNGGVKISKLKRAKFFAKGLDKLRPYRREVLKVTGKPHPSDIYAIPISLSNVHFSRLKGQSAGFIGRDRGLIPIKLAGKPWALLKWQYAALVDLGYSSDGEGYLSLDERFNDPPLNVVSYGINLGPTSSTPI